MYRPDYILPSRVFTSSHPSQGSRDIKHPSDIRQFRGYKPHVVIYTYPSLICHRSRIVTLTILYDNYVMHTFTYADMPSLSEAR